MPPTSLPAAGATANGEVPKGHELRGWRDQHQPPALRSSLLERDPTHAAEMLPSPDCE